MTETANSSSVSHEKLFSVWIADRKIMILDSNAGSRNGIAKLLISLGAKSNNISLAADSVAAKDELSKKFHPVVIADYQFTGGNGLSLAQELHHSYAEREKIFILFTSDGSQSLVAQAAEEDVDMFVIKPYTIKHFTEKLTKTVLEKIYPSEYLKTIQEGKRYLRASDPDAALEQFNKARALNEKPTLAYFYKGQAELYKQMMNQAETSFQEGLKINDIHYRCLTGMFDLLISQSKTAEAYAIAKKISSVFPSNPKRLTQLIGLSIQTGHFEDIESYYEAFKGIETRSEDLIKTVCAGLIISAKHALNKKNTQLATDLLKKAAISASGTGSILKEIALIFCELGLVQDALSTLKRFSAESGTDPAYLISRLAVKNLEEKDSYLILNEIQSLEKKSIKEPCLYFWKIKRLKQIEKADEAMESMKEACQIWPERASYFRGAIE